MYAYTGKTLYIDLTAGSHSLGFFDEDFAKKYIGGTGFGLKMLMDHLKPGTGPFDP